MMNKQIFKSIGAAIAGIIVGATLSLLTDSVLESANILPRGGLFVSAGIIWFILGYRTLYNIIGFYIVARLAPKNPMKHALVVGGIGTAVSILGALANADGSLGPVWYAWVLAILTMPAAWVGGMIHEKLRNHR